MSDAGPRGASLEGKLIAVPETRELDLFVGLLERRGARALRFPLVSIQDAPDPGPVLHWLRAFAAGGCDDLILMTGEGLRRLRGCIARHEPSLEAPFLAALARVRRITRGPKPARALRELGLRPQVEADPPTTAGVIASLGSLDLRGRRVGLQLYGIEPNLRLQAFLRGAGASVHSVAPYVYADGASAAVVDELLAELNAGRVDAIAFTSKQQIERLFRSADAAQVRAALSRTAVAAVGPVVAETLAGFGVPVRAMPGESWFMKPLTAELEALFSSTGAAGS
ncbi:MAG TPA: uroporphyrinogen-III synthase [Steroidobacteraceae bacterium]|nr:uroporphyrinogen-III synthase [Steroidobacteraceae bacterium]